MAVKIKAGIPDVIEITISGMESFNLEVIIQHPNPFIARQPQIMMTISNYAGKLHCRRYRQINFRKHCAVNSENFQFTSKYSCDDVALKHLQLRATVQFRATCFVSYFQKFSSHWVETCDAILRAQPHPGIVLNAYISDPVVETVVWGVIRIIESLDRVAVIPVQAK
ncbi:MAG TPA: hypothetical protein VGM63_03630 [Mucilaginibacter sp.]